MTERDYEALVTQLLQSALDLQRSKRPGYTRGSADVLQNFKSVGARLGLSPEQTWGVYATKHWDAVMSALLQPELPVSEALEGRVADLINYALLGYALFVEREQAATRQVLLEAAALQTVMQD